MSESSPLVALIRDYLQRHGPVAFSWFMEQALYHPEYGYYTSARLRIGKQGGCYTNVSVCHLYGQLLGGQLVEMWKLLGKPSRFTVVEQGAEDGQLACDNLSASREDFSKAGQCSNYTILEPTPAKQRQEQARLESLFFAKMRWLPGLADLEG